MDMKAFRTYLASHQKALSEARSDALDDSISNKELARYAKATAKSVAPCVAALRELWDEWDRLARLGSYTAQELGGRDWPFKEADADKAKLQFERWATKFAQDLESYIKTLKE